VEQLFLHVDFIYCVTCNRLCSQINDDDRQTTVSCQKPIAQYDRLKAAAYQSVSTTRSFWRMQVGLYKEQLV